MSSSLSSSSSTCSRTSSPTKPGKPLGYQPNPHPYSIKTTSTGILSRSATTSTSVSHSHNHYVPLAPSPSPTRLSFSHSEHGSRHRYSKSLTEDGSPRPLPPPPDDVTYLPRRSRGRAETLPVFDSANPKQWSSAQLAAKFPDIGPFIEEHEITGRAFLRFDEGVLDAYGVKQQWQRSLILSASHSLRKSAPKSRIWPENQEDVFNTPMSHSGSASVGSSPIKPRAVPLPIPDYAEDIEDDPAYLSSSSASSSSLADAGERSSRRRKKPKSNSRVHGIIASLERTSSMDGHVSTSPTRDHSGREKERGDYPVLGSRPLPYPPPAPYLIRPAKTGNSTPSSSFPFSSNASVSLVGDGYDVGNVTLTQAASTRAAGRHPTGNAGTRPLPSPPPPLFLRKPQLIDGEEDGAAESNETSTEQLLAALGPEQDNTPNKASVLLGNVTTRRSKKSRSSSSNHPSVSASASGRTGAAAWEDMDPGETVKRAPPTPAAGNPPLVIVQPVPVRAKTLTEEELTVEELLALEGDAGGEDGVGVQRGGVGAWLGGPAAGVTAKRVTPAGEGNVGMGSGKERSTDCGRGWSTRHRVRERGTERMDARGLEDVFFSASVDGHRRDQTEDAVGLAKDNKVGQVGGVPEVSQVDEVQHSVTQQNPTGPIVNATRHVSEASDSEDPAISALEAQMEETRCAVELLRKRVAQVEENVARMGGELEMGKMATNEMQQHNEPKGQPDRGQQQRIDAEVQVDLQLTCGECPDVTHTQAQVQPHARAWVSSIFNALFGLPRYALGLYYDKSTSTPQDVPLCKRIPRYALNLCVGVSRYAFGVPRYTFAMGFAVPRYALLLGIGVCMLVLKSVNMRGRGLLRGLLGGGGGSAVAGRMRR